MLKYELLLDAVTCMVVGNHLERVNMEDVDSYINAKKGKQRERAAHRREPPYSIAL